MFRVIAKRVIPCLDVHDGKVTRGVQFGKAEAGELRNVGDPVELALRYNEQGADEMVFFDITASAHGRATMVDVIERAADQCFMPLTVGGGIKSVDDMFTMLRAGADKISINSSALAKPELIRAGAEKFGSQCIVVSIDAKKIAPDKWGVFSHGGRKATGLDAVEWAKTRRGARRGRNRVELALTPTARRPGLIWSSRGASANPWACRWWPAAARARWNTWPRCCSKARPTPCWPRAFSISANTPSAT